MFKRFFAVGGMAVCLLSVLLGILILCGVFGGLRGNYPTSTTYDHGYAMFGNDYYTYMNNNAAATTSAISSVNRNIIAQSKLIKNISGLAFMSVGIIGFFAFGTTAVDSINLDGLSKISDKVSEYTSKATHSYTGSSATAPQKPVSAAKPDNTAPVYKTNPCPQAIVTDDKGYNRCPCCDSTVDINDLQCPTCGQVFANSITAVPYWCKECGQEGPYLGACPVCKNTVKLRNPFYVR